MSKKILVVVAHPDDEILGVGGTILKHVKNGDKVSILILSDGETSRGDKADIVKRQKQAEKVKKSLGVKELILKSMPDNKFDSVPLLEIVKKVEEVVYKIKPETIYTHNPNDLNIDHRLTCEAVLTSCRPQPNFFVKNILVFETLSSTEWQIKDSQHFFCPTQYVDISKFINKKIEVLKVYKNELRQYPHPRSIEGVSVLAKFRGMEVGLKYAEAFQIIRVIS
jgi:LmbE family N-acetylglucosaminyl deacetylase